MDFLALGRVESILDWATARGPETIRRASAATWAEFDLEAKIWTVPAARMKMHREHRVPLSPQALKLLQELKDSGAETFVFTGAHPRKHLSNMAMLAVLERMGRADLFEKRRRLMNDWAKYCDAKPKAASRGTVVPFEKRRIEARHGRG